MKIAREPTHLLTNMDHMMIEYSAMDWLTIQLMNLLKNAKTVKHLFGMQHHWRKKMKAKELIELLQKYDGETEVKICDSRLPVYDPIEICDLAYEDDRVLIIEGE